MNKEDIRLIENKNLTRKFLGKIDGFRDKRERNFEKKHLRAYLKGHAIFRDGSTLDPNTGIRHPNMFKVQQEYSRIA